MSRAFVKEDDGAPDQPSPRSRSRHPNYLTPDGLRDLQTRLETARAQAHAADVAQLEQHLENAIVVDPATQPKDVARFGASVTVEDPAGARQTYRIVGENEADPLHGAISWTSPLAQALAEKRAGQRVTWERPAGNVRLRIISIQY